MKQSIKRKVLRIILMVIAPLLFIPLCLLWIICGVIFWVYEAVILGPINCFRGMWDLICMVTEEEVFDKSTKG